MSADNEIATIKFRDKCAVGMIRGCPTQNEIEKFIPTGDDFNQEFTVFDTEEEADDFASRWIDTLNDAGEIVEYGLTSYTVDRPIIDFQEVRT